MKFSFLLVLMFVASVSFGSDEESEMVASKVIGEAYGDLDKDGIHEKVIVLDTGLEGDFGTERVLLIYKKIKGKWTTWHFSHGPVLGSDHGGMMGDPFDGIDIVRGSIVIHHFGGSRQKWNYTHRYRFDNHSWKLIGATINYGAPCEGFMSFDYNLSTGKALYEKKQDECPDEYVDPDWKDVQKEVSLGVLNLPNMDGFYPGSNEVEIDIGDIKTKVHY